jgi:glycosyltransferase involved in cell wall biosynthesis
MPLDVRSNLWSRWDRAWTYYASASRPWALVRAYAALRSRRPDAIYLNSFFNVAFSILPQLLGRFGLWRDAITLLAPRGEFGAAALAKSPRRKKIYLRLYQILSFDKKIVWHACNESEARDITSILGKTAAVVVRENETSLPRSSVWEPSRQASDDHQRVALSAFFLGRVVPHKGVLLLLRALASVTDEVALNIFGPEEDPLYARACRDEIARLPPKVVASLRGPLSESQVLAAIRDHDVMLFPTAGESFGHVIAESLFCGRPVVCTDKTPWTTVVRSGGGEIVESLAPLDWAKSIDRWASLSNAGLSERQRMASRAYDEWRRQGMKGHILSDLRRVAEAREYSRFVRSKN